MTFWSFIGSALCGLAVVSLAPALAAQPAPSSADVALSRPLADREVGDYCNYVRAVAASESALLLSPSLLLSYSNLPAGGVEPAAGVEAVGAAARSRLQAGLVLSPSRMYRGVVTNQLARAECDRYAAASRVQLLPESAAAGRAPLEAKIRVLDEAVRKGRELTTALAKKLEESLATVEDYGALALQVDNLVAQLTEAQLRLAELPAAPATAGAQRSGPLQLASATARAEDLKGRLRRSQALEVELRGGYYRVFGASTSAPYFVMASLQFNPGWFWQGSAETRAQAAVSAWIAARTGPRGPTLEEREGFKQRSSLSRARAAELSVTLEEMEAKRRQVQAVPGEQAQRYANVLWLQLAKLRAERAFLDATAAELDQALQQTEEQLP